MGRTFVRQATQIRKSDSYLDTVQPTEANYETNTTSIEDDLNNLRSQIQNLLNRNGASFPTGNWYDDISVPSGFENGSKRGVSEINQQLHNLERKRVLTSFVSLTDVLVSGSQNWAVLALAETPNPSIPVPRAVAVGGSSTVTGSVAASITIGSHSLSEVGGATTISPKNLCMIVTGSNRDPILSSGSVVYGLFQTDKSDGQVLAGGDAQLSFVKVNDTGDDLIACPVVDIEGKRINYVSVTRKALEDLSEQDFLRGAEIDVPSSTSATRQNSYDNQGTTPVELTTNAVLDIGTGLYWQIRDNANASLLKVTEGSTGGNTTFLVDTDVDVFDVNAGVNDFASGVTVASAGTDIKLGVNAGVIETTSTDNLRILGAGELFFDDGNQSTSTWADTNGIKLSDTALEWTTFSGSFGETSLLKAIYQSKRRDKVYATVNTTVAADSDVSATAGNINVQLPATKLPYMNSGSFMKDYDVYLNGQLLYPGADSGAGNDYYPGSDEFSLKFEFAVKSGDVICVVPYIRD
jgi:hypothetical protein